MALTPGNAQALACRRGARKKTVHCLIIVTAYAVADTLRHRMEPCLYHNSKLTGIDWVCELLDGHPERIRDCLGVHKHVFKKLVEELFQLSHLEATKGVTTEEQVAVFLYMVKTGLGYRQVAERFQRSNETIYWCVFSQFDGTILTVTALGQDSPLCPFGLRKHCFQGIIPATSQWDCTGLHPLEPKILSIFQGHHWSHRRNPYFCSTT